MRRAILFSLEDVWITRAGRPVLSGVSLGIDEGFTAVVGERDGVRWATRTAPHVDRTACAWLIRRFIDAEAEFVFVAKIVHEADLGDERRAARPGLQVAEPHRELRGERTRHGLRHRQALLVLGLRVPTPLRDQVAVHVPDQRDRSAKAHGSQHEEVLKQGAETAPGHVSIDG